MNYDTSQYSLSGFWKILEHFFFSDGIEAHLEEINRNEEYIIYCNLVEVGAYPDGPFERLEICKDELARRIRFRLFSYLKRNSCVDVVTTRMLSIDCVNEDPYKDFVRLRMIVILKPSNLSH